MSAWRRVIGTRGAVSWLAAVAVTACLGWAGQADASVYWTNFSAGTVGRANLDGSGADPNFITGASFPVGLAVDGERVYWTNFVAGAVGRANHDGSGANQGFITGAAANDPFGVATDGRHVYWTNLNTGTIGRANIDGSGANQGFITGASRPSGVALDDRDIYWANALAGTIGRANLDGSSADQGFVTGANGPSGVAVDDRHVYWANALAGTIGRANLDGSGADQGFITGASNPQGLAVDDRHVYWTNRGTGTIGRADLDGSGADQGFITGAGDPLGVAVDGGPAGSASASAASLAFGTQPLGTYGAARPLTITNAGHGNLAIDAARLAGGDVDDFLISLDTCSQSTLTIGATCAVHVRFGPSASGERQAVLELTSNDPASPLRIHLQGSAGQLPQGPTGPTGSPGPVGPAGRAAAPVADREFLLAAFAANGYRVVGGSRLRLRYFNNLAAQITIELRRDYRVVKRKRRTAARGPNAIALRIPRARGRYLVRLTAVAGTQRVTDEARLTVI